MFRDKDATVTLAVKDLETAGRFYEETLGLERVGPIDPQLRNYKSGNTAILVYVSQYAGTNQATAAAWSLGDEFDEVMKMLEGKGVVFEHYDDLPDMTRQGNVHVVKNAMDGKDFKSSWFKDPDGNILSIMNA
jgi:catechol 2,3-dioxygenase-like lactoylglutathione lyase family enzyme